MFAVFKTGGKQYKVEKDDIIEVEKLDKEKGKIAFDTVLMIDDKVGAPFVKGAKVEAEVLDQKKADKVIVFKKKRRHNYRRKKGHRQELTVLKITNIVGA